MDKPSIYETLVRVLTPYGGDPVLVGLIGLAAGISFVWAFTDLRTQYSNAFRKPLPLAAAFLFRLSGALILIWLFVTPWVQFAINFLAAFVNIVIWQYAILITPIRQLYGAAILKTEGLTVHLDPLFEAKRDALIRTVSLAQLRRLAQVEVQEFRNSTIREMFEEDMKKRAAKTSVDTYATVLLCRIAWEDLTGIFTGLENMTRNELKEAERLVRKAAANGDIATADIRAYLGGTKRDKRSKRPKLWKLRSWSDERARLYALRALCAEVGRDGFQEAIDNIPGARKRMELAAALTIEVRQPQQALPWAPGLKLLSLELENIRCFKSVSLDFSHDFAPRSWTLLLGDNGLGKSTVLRCIAMSLCDQTATTALMKSLAGDLLRRGEDNGTIMARFHLADDPEFEGWCRTTISSSFEGTVILKQERSPNFPRDRIFVTGYGAMRSGFGTQSYGGYAPEDALRTLFDPSVPLQNPELAIRRMESLGQDIGQIRAQLEEMLALDAGSIDITSSGITIMGPWGSFVPVGAIGDGYQATLAWVADLLGWSILFNAAHMAQRPSGIVLIDEIEKHLHPRWQRQILSQLNRQFPELQFIATTHSPLCAGGLADIENAPGAMYRLRREGTGVIIAEPVDLPGGLRYDQIVLSEAFGLQSARSEKTAGIIDALRKAQEAGDEEEARRQREFLAELSPNVAEEERERGVQLRINKILDGLQRLGDGSS